jgi:hypothetical protein
MFGDISNFNKITDYLPIFNGVLISELIIILLLHVGFFKSIFLKKWYLNFNISAVIMDVFILVIGFIITRYLYKKMFNEYKLWKFILLFLIVQIIHDILFYILFEHVIPKGNNTVIDLFKKYGKEVGVGAIIGDSFMVILSCIIASLLVTKNVNFNIIFCILTVYIIPYLIF